jgi:AraC-like DNA-binding protein
MRRRTRLLDRVFRYIDDNFRDPIRLTDVADSVGHVPAYLTDVVRGVTGRPVHKWIAERRLSEARRLLSESDAPIGEVARAAGFRDPAYFSRAFVRASGQAPSRWRRTYARSFPNDALDAAAIATTAARIAAAERAMAAASSRNERDDLLFAAAVAIVPLRVTVNRRDPATGAWYHYRSSDVAFTDTDASVPLLLYGCTAAELQLERSYFPFYRNLAQVRQIEGFFKLPLFVDGVCTGALCAIVDDAADLTRERRYALEELARAYGRSPGYVQMR